MWPGEAIALYLHDLKRLLRQAMSELAENASKPLLLHQFLSGLPGPVSRQLRATGDTKELEAVVQRAKVLMTVSDQQQTAAMTTTPREVDQLKPKSHSWQNKWLHLQQDRKMKGLDTVYTVTDWGTLSVAVPHDSQARGVTSVIDQVILQEIVGRETPRGCLPGQQASPIPVSPNNTIVVATIKSHAANTFGKVGGINTEIMLDSGSSVSLLSQDTATKMTGARLRPLPQVQLQTASGESLLVIDCVSVDVQLNLIRWK